jgi:hypothetical protein
VSRCNAARLAAFPAPQRRMGIPDRRAMPEQATSLQIKGEEKMNQTTPPAAPDQSKRSNTWLIIVVVLVVLCCIGIIVAAVGWQYGDQLLKALGQIP